MTETADFRKYQDLVESGDRTQAYIEYAEDLAAMGEFGGYHQAMIMAQISSYSGELGGGAIIGNVVAASENEDYNVSLDQFSEDVAKNLFRAVKLEAEDERSPNQGFLNDAEMRAMAYYSWDEKGLAAEFPGNYQREIDREDGYVNVNFGDQVMESFFQNDSANYQGDETGMLDNIGSAPIVAVISPAIGNMPEEYGFTEEQLNAVRSGGDPVTLANGLTLSFHEVERPDGTVLDSYTAIRTPENKLINVINEYNEDYFNTGGRIVNDPETEKDAYYGLNFSESQWQMGTAQWALDDVETNAQLRHFISEEYPQGLPEALKDEDALRDEYREAYGDKIKNIMGADMTEYGIRRDGTDIQTFSGFPGRPGYDPESVEAFPSNTRQHLDLTTFEAMDIVIDNLEEARTELSQLEHSGKMDDQAICVQNGIDSAFATALYAELIDNDVNAVTIPYDTDMTTAIDRVNASLTAGANAFEGNNLSMEAAEARMCEVSEEAMEIRNQELNRFDGLKEDLDHGLGVE